MSTQSLSVSLLGDSYIHQVWSFDDFETQNDGKMPLALLLSTHSDLYPNVSERAVGSSNITMLILFFEESHM